MIDRRRAAWILAFAVAATSHAEDPPRRPNQVSATAQAAMDAYAKLVYRPAEHGLRSVAGVLVRDGDDVAHAKRFEFVPPGRVTTGDGGDAERPRVPSLVRFLVELPLRAALEGMPMTEWDEYDADVVERDGRRVLVVTTRGNGTDNPVGEFTLDAEGLVSSWRRTPSPDTPRTHWFETTSTFTWAKMGGLRRVVAIDLSGVDNSKIEFHAKFVLEYADVEGVQAPASVAETISSGTKSRTTEYRVDELVINGRAVDVPRPPSAGHVTPEATVLLQRASRLVHRPGDHGVATMSATILPEWAPGCGPARVELAGRHRLTIAFPSAPMPAPRESGVARESLRRMLLPAFEGVQPAWTKDYDAVVEERDGKKIVVVTDHGEGDDHNVCEVRFDAAGLVETTRDRTGPDPADPHCDTTIRYAWERSGDLYRIASMQFVRMVFRGEPADSATPSPTYSYAYEKVDGVDVLRSFTVSHEGRPPTTYRLEDLVVDGKRIDPVPPAKK
jgi:hypothetical protein